ncbi:UDP binding domain-containing protein, partial [Hoeflea sp.]|uniref:UDP binding domain-containing protein n=1 Tax=Hoeflea sp. TaxID=1940281 RepID=UPI00198C4F5A
GGHCIPIDPFYLTWKAREFDISTRFIELAGEINSAMPHRVVERLAQALDAHGGKGLNGAKVLIAGIAYKKNVDDMRESPALKIIEILERRGAQIAYFDPFVPVIPATREHAELAGWKSVAWRADVAADYDAVLIVTDHDTVDYAALVAHAPLIVDTRNACRKAGVTAGQVFHA